MKVLRGLEDLGGLGVGSNITMKVLRGLEAPGGLGLILSSRGYSLEV